MAARARLHAARVTSARARERVATVRGALRPHRDVQAVRDFEALYRQVAA